MFAWDVFIICLIVFIHFILLHLYIQVVYYIDNKTKLNYFRAPPYRKQDIEDDVDVFVELERPSDGARSEPRIFRYKPCGRLGRKRPRYQQSGSLSSGELPTTIDNISQDVSSLVFDSDFFRKAENIESDEFNNLVERYMPEYRQLCNEPSVNIQNELQLYNPGNTTDGPIKPSTST